MYRKIGVVTGTRAEYGLLKKVMDLVNEDPKLLLQLFVTGMHLSPKFGNTINQIEEDGFVITDKIYSLEDDNSPIGVLNSLANGIKGFAKSFHDYLPDVVIILGDRYESFAAAQACLILNIPLAHIHGGELTEGAFDDSIRHSISKIANIHFPSAKEYAKRLEQMGEMPERIYLSGAPGLDAIKEVSYLSKEELSQTLNHVLQDYALMTFHPVTMSYEEGLESLSNTLKFLLNETSLQIILTQSNSDPRSDEIKQIQDTFIEKYPNRVFFYKSLGQLKYLSAMKHASLVIGNSSSGIIEAPMFKITTIDIGKRQAGRLKSSSVISCKGSYEDIREAFLQSQSSEFQKKLKSTKSLYGNGEASKIIVKVLKAIELKNIIQKKFNDKSSL